MSCRRVFAVVNVIVSFTRILAALSGPRGCWSHLPAKIERRGHAPNAPKKILARWHSLHHEWQLSLRVMLVCQQHPPDLLVKQYHRDETDRSDKDDDAHKAHAPPAHRHTSIRPLPPNCILAKGRDAQRGHPKYQDPESLGGFEANGRV